MRTERASLQFQVVSHCGATVMWTVTKIIISAMVIAAVSEVGRQSPRLGALLLTLPIVSMLAFAITWMQDRDLPAVSRMARETLVLVPLGLPFFVPLAWSERLGLGFWSAAALGVLLASLTIGVWLRFGPLRF
jgi:hypothetical protein